MEFLKSFRVISDIFTKKKGFVQIKDQVNDTEEPRLDADLAELLPLLDEVINSSYLVGFRDSEFNPILARENWLTNIFKGVGSALDVVRDHQDISSLEEIYNLKCAVGHCTMYYTIVLEWVK
eukprot:TRINITY_DN4427_c0_g1_i1.p1 TRINITY_DN4427_c0_g1~~TRINITY_DN4427_c0_g1_i1.p1  ORF type:complete len:122 (-),score=4.98 TRINITY_DN4427_c0_g1_i1:145-510(-)